MTIFRTARGTLEIHEIRSIAEMSAAEEIQSLVWGIDIIPTPKEMLIAVQHEGGFLAGAFNAENRMVSLVFSFPTQDPTAHHSQLLATLAKDFHRYPDESEDQSDSDERPSGLPSGEFEIDQISLGFDDDKAIMEYLVHSIGFLPLFSHQKIREAAREEPITSRSPSLSKSAA